MIENLQLGKEDATIEECINVCKIAHADEFINKLPDKYNTYIEQNATNISGGQKQRICIARALLKNPKILFLDDSTSAVDTITDKEIRHSLKTQLPKTTKFIISQRISSIKHADKIIVLEKGKVTGFSTHEKLLNSNQTYKQMYENQTKEGGSINE